MDRRDFLKLTSLAGFSLVTPIWARGAQAMGNHDGPFWVLVNAGGGWDPTSLCDPKGRRNEETPDPMNMYFTGDIGEAGRLRYAPVGNNAYFFDKYFRELLVINGIDSQTNGHSAGTRHTWSGRLAEGHPSFGALLAASTAPEKPMAMLTNGGYDFTAGLIGPSRVGDVGTLQQIAFPNRNSPDDANSEFHTPETWSRIAEASAARLERQRDAQHLPRERDAMSLLYTARASDNELSRLTDFLPDDLDNSGNPLRRQAQIAIAAFKAGLSVSANLDLGGFDTHGNHDESHIPRLEQLLDGVDFLMEEAERQNIRDDLIVAVGSDFGRTPGYNDNNGKDHWSITSMMFMGAGINGNRVIGSSDDGHRPYEIDPDTLETADNGGIRINPVHIHQAMRDLAGISEHELAVQFPLGAERLDLF